MVLLFAHAACIQCECVVYFPSLGNVSVPNFRAAAYQELLQYFAEDPKTQSDEFFRAWANFITAFEKVTIAFFQSTSIVFRNFHSFHMKPNLAQAREDNRKAEENKANAEKKAKIAEEKAAKLKARQSVQVGLVDNLLRDLKPMGRAERLRTMRKEGKDGYVF